MKTKTREQFAKLHCLECRDIKFLTEQQYDRQMMEAHKGWRCPDCRCYPCNFDDEYFERKLA